VLDKLFHRYDLAQPLVAIEHNFPIDHVPPVLVFEAETFCASNSICEPDLSHIVGFCSGGVAVNVILNLARKDLPIGITGYTRG
jgi:hypothetical protein